jgi:hypothetical protein
VVLRAVAADRAAVQASVSVAIEPNVALNAAPALLYILVRDIVVDVAHRVTKLGSVEVCVRLPDGQRDGCLDVLGTAGRVLVPSNADRFDPWSMSSDEPTSLGLSVADRIARILGWSLDVVSDERREGLRVSIPAASFCSESRACGF